MRLIPIYLLISVCCLAAELTVDHVTVAGRDLKTMQAKLESIGIRAEYGGPHANHATEMTLTSFPDGSYLELIAIQPNADPKAVSAHEWKKQMEENSGPCAWAVRVKDVAAEVARLRSAGVQVTDAERNGRRRPDGVRLEWETAGVGENGRGLFFPFLIRDFTPRQQRAYPSGKPTTKDIGGVAKVVVAVRNLQDAVERYRKAYGLPAPLKQVDTAFGAQLASMGGTPVVLAAPLNMQSWLNERIDKYGEGPCAFVLAARKMPRTGIASHSRWFGGDVSWFDMAKLGWRLGLE